jgi:TRAP-type C4-dicarboxylate transport system permease small subunit
MKRSFVYVADVLVFVFIIALCWGAYDASVMRGLPPAPWIALALFMGMFVGAIYFAITGCWIELRRIADFQEKNHVTIEYQGPFDSRQPGVASIERLGK